MISYAYIENFRSIKKLEVSAHELNAIVGPNNAGKSNILRAIHVVLGPKWPAGSLSLEDKHRGQLNAPIRIAVGLDPPLRKDYYGVQYDVHGLALEFHGPDQTDFVCLDDQFGQIATGKYGNPLKVDNALRGQAPTWHVEAKRDLAGELRAGQWTVLGRLLKGIEEQLSQQPEFVKQFTKAAQDYTDLVKQEPIKVLEQMLDAEVKGISGLSGLELKFEPPRLLDALKSLQIFMTEHAGAVPSNAEDLGQGLQSALVIALVRAYQSVMHVNPILLLEEPEAYLHPQARRAFHTQLDTLARGKVCQVFYTTHSSEFVDVTEPQRITLVRKRVKEGTTATQGDKATLTAAAKTALKIEADVDVRLKEIFFSSCVLACEGDAEGVSVPVLLKKAGIDPDKLGWTVVSAGSKDNLPFVLRLCEHFGIPRVAIYDDDTDKPDFTTKHAALNAQLAGLAGGADRCWVAAQDFEQQHSIPRGGSKKRAALQWALSRSDAEARRIVGPLLARIAKALS